MTPLTLRQRQIARLAAAGRTSKEIGEELGISTQTVKSHRSEIMRKLGVRNAVELAIKWRAQ